MLMLRSGCEKNLLVEFSQKNYRENLAFWEEFAFPDQFFCTERPVSNFWIAFALRRHLLNSR